jgi:4-amino-4-deoxy-L-arabinose transferase-like glycosyltransferase
MRSVVKITQALSRIASLIDRRPVLVLPIWIAAFIAVFWRVAQRPLWYDELFTYHIAMSPTLDHFINCVRIIDLNPPLGYIFVRASVTCFGDSPLSVRLPSMLAFFGASLIAFRLIARRFGGGLGLAALGLFWSFPLAAYAVEARPYALLLAFFSIATACWLRAIESTSWTSAHAGLASAIVAMLLTHCFSPVFAAAIGVGELTRSIVLRRIDTRIWAALLSPLSLLPLYIPLIKNAQALVYPPAFAATVSTVPQFYVWMFLPVLPVVGLIVATLPLGKLRSNGTQEVVRPHEVAFCVAALLAPAGVIGYAIWSGVPFWPRYGICATLSGSLILTVLLAAATRRNANAALVSATLILVLFLHTRAGTDRLMERYENTSTLYRTIRPELPFVAASGLTFLEMDHRESNQFTSRLYYLTDRESALRYAHATIFEGMPIVRRWFPVRARVSPYKDFTSCNSEFLVLDTPGSPEDWLLSKLKDDGARIDLVLDAKPGYRDRQLFLVSLRK